MTDREKVIKGLEICSEHGSWHGLNCEDNEAYKDCPYRGCETGCVVTIAKDALALLKEQEAKQVVLYDKEEWLGLVCVCPDCKASWMTAKANTHFCPNCGQAVKWE